MSLGLLSEGWLTAGSSVAPALTLLSGGWLYEQVADGEVGAPASEGEGEASEASTSGGRFLLRDEWRPIRFLRHPWQSTPGPDPDALDIARRSETLAAAVAVAIEDGDEANRLAATIALLLAWNVSD